MCKKENDPKVKENLLLIIKLREDKQIPFCVVKELHRSNTWALDWLKRYDKEGLKGLKDRTKVGRPPELSKDIVYQIKKELSNSNQGWRTTKQVEVNHKEKRNKISLYQYISSHPSKMEI